MSTSTSLIRIAFVLSALAPAALAEPSVDEAPSTRPQPMYIRVPAAPNTGISNAVSSRLVFLHRCPVGAGCAVRFGTTDDSRTDTSSIVNGQRIIGEFKQGDEVWNAAVECVKKTFAPFDIQVTDQDPGTTTPHFENIVGGSPTDLGRSDLQNAGGVAPFTCSEVPNAIVYTFDVYGPDAEQLCWTSAQEVAHAFGLDHEVLQKDPMTYVQGDLPKRFRDEPAECGELQVRPCGCPRSKQNSYRMIVDLFGPGAPTPPEVTVDSPGDGNDVQPGFRAVVTAVDDVRTAKVEMYADGALVATQMMPTMLAEDKFYITGPTDLAMGSHTLEFRAYDVQNVIGTATITVNQGPPCTQATGCSGTDACVQGVCLPGPDQPGGLGSRCTSDTECLSQHCVDAGETQKHCVEDCDPATTNSCPGGFECLADGSVCWPAPDSGCCDAGTTPQGPLLLGIGVLALVLRRRRPARA